MTFEKVLEALIECEGRLLDEMRSTPLHSAEHMAQFAHCLYMIRQVRTWPADRIGKAFRWLGFIQGVLYAHDLATIEELKETNRPTEAVAASRSEVALAWAALSDDQREHVVEPVVNHFEEHAEDNTYDLLGPALSEAVRLSAERFEVFRAPQVARVSP